MNNCLYSAECSTGAYREEAHPEFGPVFRKNLPKTGPGPVFGVNNSVNNF